jgi:neutral ceramidase
MPAVGFPRPTVSASLHFLPMRVRGVLVAVVMVGIAGMTRGSDGVVPAADPRPAAPAWRAGVASARITPDRPLPMAGYAVRTEPAEGTEQELYAKALVLEDAAGGRTLWITLDLIGATAGLREAVASRLTETLGLPAAALLMNASHTHCGPDYDHAAAAEYRAFLETTLVDLAGRAVQTLAPANLAFGTARASVAMNRRTPTSMGYINHPNPAGPVDHAVPVLSVRAADAALRALVFGYACHNTTMAFRRWLGDYAGYAQEYLEADHPGTTALFMMGCAGDQNPYPRRQLVYAQRHGRTLATAVEAAIEADQNPPRHQRPVTGLIRAALERVDLPFADASRPPHRYPVQVIRLGDDILLVALGMETTVDYALRIKEEFAAADGPAVWVAGYSNDYPGYIPSRRVLLEGGYEATRTGPWDPGLEEKILTTVRTLVERTRPGPSR